jgi:hypothetical protein
MNRHSTAKVVFTNAVQVAMNTRIWRLKAYCCNGGDS